MCGIAGILLKKPNKEIKNQFLKISKDLSHRGPDASEKFEDEKQAFIHTRLSIIDLEGGNQPIKNNHLVLVANGEIYNDHDIRAKFHNYNFKTKSDSESIMAIYSNEGLVGLKKLRGMYAFALYDKQKKITILSRDIFGIKPLYFHQFQSGFLFSSEIKAIRNLNFVKKKIDKDKLLEHLELQYSSGKKTIFKDIYRVRPGEILVIENGKIKKSILQHLPIEKKKTYKINHNLLEKKLKESVSVHLRSDVPYCLFFSGGIDSMLIMYLMQNLDLDKKIEAYKVNIIEKEKPDNHLLKKISQEYRIQFNEIDFTEEDFWKTIPFAAKHIDEPVADYAILPTFKLAEEASKNFKVAITGEGGDELFGGYGRYRSQNFFFKKKKFFKGTFRKFKNFNKNYWKFETNQNFVESLDLTAIQKHQYFDYINWLPNDLLVKLDRCLMTYGMEGRTPLVDKKLFESFFCINDKYKINRGFGKFLIRDFLDKKVKYYNSFKKKEGFTIPIYNWIPKKSKQLEEILPKSDILRYFFTKDEIIELCRSSRFNKKNVKALWHMIFITAWYYVVCKKEKIKGNFFEIIRS